MFILEEIQCGFWTLDLLFFDFGTLECGALSKLFGNHALSIHKTKQVIGLKSKEVIFGGTGMILLKL